MSQSNQRATAFVHRLLSNPTLKNYTPLQKEDQVSQFLLGNIEQLTPTLSSPAFFPNTSINSISDLLLRTLQKLTDERLIPALKALVQRINYTFVQAIQMEQCRPSIIQEQILRSIHKALAIPQFRQLFSASYTVLHYDLVNRYLSESFKRQRHIFYEITKIQRLSMNKEDIQSYVEVLVLLKSLVHSSGTTPDKTGLISPSSTPVLIESLNMELSNLPKQVVNNIVGSNVSVQDDSQYDMVARIASILYARGRSYITNVRVDRGAETPDKSWLSIARRNYKYYGFDIKILDEFYVIAAENGW